MARTAVQIYPSVVSSPARRGPAIVHGSFTLGAAGAIASATGFMPITTTAGTFGVIKTAAKTGRYSFVMDRKYRNLTVVGCELIGPSDTAFGNTVANQILCRNQTTNSFDLQLVLASSGVDTDGASGYIVTYVILIERYGGKD